VSAPEQATGYDIIGDVHGCLDELCRLLDRLGYAVTSPLDIIPPASRAAVFLGDLANRGPQPAAVLRLVMAMVGAGAAMCVAGNHDVALAAGLRGRSTKPVDGLEETLRQLDAESDAFQRDAAAFLDGLPQQLALDGGRLVIAHAGLPEEYHGVDTPEAGDFAVNGRRIANANGELVRYRWAEDYHGSATVVYGHYSQPDVAWLNNTICLDTGCVYGGRLTALRYPERELVWVPAEQAYYETERTPAFRAAASGAGA
jgi:predicted phosphodiesterase